MGNCAAFEPPSVPFVRSFDSQKKINWPIKQHTSSLECDLVLHKVVDGGQWNEMTGSRDGEQRQHAIRVTNSYKQFNASQIPFSEDDYFRQGSSPAKVSPPPISVPPDTASINWCAPMYGHETKTYREINSCHRVITDSRNAHLAIAGEEDKKKTLKFNSDLRTFCCWLADCWESTVSRKLYYYTIHITFTFLSSASGVLVAVCSGEEA